MTRRRSISLMLMLMLSGAGCGNNRQFNSTEWLKGDLRQRGRMVDDLVASGLLKGRSEAEVIQLLGAPARTYPQVYRYGFDLGWAFKDPAHFGLLIHFDQQSHVEQVRLVD